MTLGVEADSIPMSQAVRVPSAEDQRPSIEGVRAALAEFLDAFQALDLERFMACWAPDATLIHPFRELPRRIRGWEEIRRSWRGVFDFVRTTRDGPPYLDLRPMDLQVQAVAARVAVITFHLDLDGSLGRRTLVLEDRSGVWRIVHLHASNVG